ncbi:MAG TPA: DUF3616 domain-containing protein [Blastocatellia bacterium]|nr:DUF3616 domain-containing protein [Blastocatellia bacterium]
MKILRHRTDKRVGAFLLLAGAFLIALWTGFATERTKSKLPGVSGPGEGDLYNYAQPKSKALMIDSISFGELNDGEEYNASDIIPLADSRFLFCDNNTNDALFELDLTRDGRKKGPLIRRPLRGLAPGALDDIEDMALVEDGGRRYVFMTSSMHVKKARDDSLVVPPSGVLRVRINPDESLSAENMTGFRDWLISAYPQLAASAQVKPKDGGLNIEGLAWDKSRRALLFGLRTPTPEGKPMILPVKVKDIAGPWTTSNLEAQPPISLSVEAVGDEQGIRSLYNERDRDSFLVIVGKAVHHGEAPFSLYEWNGDAEVAPRRFNVRFAREMKPEGITRGVIDGKPALIIVDDGGGFRVLWGENGLPYASAMNDS